MNDILTEADMREIQAALQTPEGRTTIAQTMLEPQRNFEGLVKFDYMLESRKAIGTHLGLLDLDSKNLIDVTIGNQQATCVSRESSETIRRRSRKDQDRVRTSSKVEANIKVQKGQRLRCDRPSGLRSRSSSARGTYVLDSWYPHKQL